MLPTVGAIGCWLRGDSRNSFEGFRVIQEIYLVLPPLQLSQKGLQRPVLVLQRHVRVQYLSTEQARIRSRRYYFLRYSSFPRAPPVLGVQSFSKKTGREGATWCLSKPAALLASCGVQSLSIKQLGICLLSPKSRKGATSCPPHPKT